MKRVLKQHLKRLVPGTLRGAIKDRLGRKFHAPVDASIEVVEEHGMLRCTIERASSFLAPLGCKDDLRHFSSTGQGRSEFYSIAKVARRGGTLFDVGAHSGLISALFCAAHPQNRVFSFEPSPVLFPRLEEIRNLNEFGERMSLQQVGIGQASATLEMLLDPAGGYVQAQRFDHTMWSAPEVVQIPIERLEDAAARLEIIPGVIKLDIESYEYEAIRGSLDFLRQHKPMIFLEIHLDFLEQRSLSGRELVETLSACGYRFYTGAGDALQPLEVYDAPLQNVHVIAR